MTHLHTIVVFMACTLMGGCGDKSEAITQDSGTGDATGSAEAPWYCNDGGYSLDNGMVETEHYQLHLELDDAEEALQMARLAEAAYDAFSVYFDAEPPELPLVANWYSDFPTFVAELEADGITAPDAGGYYWTGTSEAYMYTQPTIYFSRMLFIHELAHQFHHLARTNNGGRNSWYSEGVAEYLSRHDWDGECIRLGRLPMLTWEDYPADALAESTYEFDGSEDLSRPWAWATYRYLQHEQTDTFDAFREAYDADGATALSDYFDIEETVDAVESWLPYEQEPMSPIFVDWIHISDGVVEGEATYFSMAVAKDGDAITTSHEATSGYAGIVAAYEDSSNNSSWLVGDDGSLWTFVVTNGEAYWWFMDDVAVADRYEWTLSGTTVTINGVSYEEANGFTPRGGIALYEAAVLFEDILF